MELVSILMDQLHPNPICQHQTVAGSAIVVGGSEILIVQAAAIAGGDDGALGPLHQMLARL